MARIHHIRARLDRWGRWRQERDTGALGYPSQAAFLRVGSGGVRGGLVASDQDSECFQTDAAVQHLRLAHGHLHRAVTLYHGKGFELFRVAAKMARAESTVRRNLEDADVVIQAWLEERRR